LSTDVEDDDVDERMKEIVELAAWFDSPVGQYLLAWEQARFDAAVADCFGYHALQLGLTQLHGLRNNRIAHRWMAVSTPMDISLKSANYMRDNEISSTSIPIDVLNTDFPKTALVHDHPPIDLVCNFSELPFESASLDLIVLPHALEFAPDPHATLREVERVLVPEGRVVVSGFNNWSLWGARQSLSQKLSHRGKAYLPRAGEFIGYRRIKDWLRLLSFEFETGHFGCYRPPVRSQAWLDRTAFMDKAGDRWWPVLGAAYCMVAVKRVKGMRMVAPMRRSPGFAPSSGLRPAINTRRDSVKHIHIKE
jgi:SAM-dependent methyltransferase